MFSILASLFLEHTVLCIIFDFHFITYTLLRPSFIFNRRTTLAQCTATPRQKYAIIILQVDHRLNRKIPFDILPTPLVCCTGVKMRNFTPIFELLCTLRRFGFETKRHVANLKYAPGSASYVSTHTLSPIPRQCNVLNDYHIRTGKLWLLQYRSNLALQIPLYKSTSKWLIQYCRNDDGLQ